MDVVSFFAGCGGLDLGFEQAGFHVVWANEFEPHCRATYTRNLPNTEFVLDDICNIDPATIPDCDGFIGGPPCQSWSVGGKQKGLDDERGQLFLKYIELINVKKPKFFVIENVKGLLDDKFKDVFADFVFRLGGTEYNLHWTLLDAINFRVPQNRERVFFVGFRKDLDVTFSFPAPTCTEPVTLEKAIGDIIETPNFYSGRKSIDVVTINNKRPNHDVLDSKFGSFYYRGNRRKGWKQPSFTINATAEFAPLHPSSPKMMYYGHENWNFQKDKMDQYRRLSVRECARIQTFPDSFIFEYENIKEGYKMIGNAVPPRLAKEIAKSIINALNRIVEPSSIQNKRDLASADTVLVGYCKSENYRNLILRNRIYYVRSDGRRGSLFREDCSVIPKYLLLHHKENACLFRLDEEEPILVDSSFLKSIGFMPSGDKYLCFRLETEKPIFLDELGNGSTYLKYDPNVYYPFFTTIEKVLDTKYEC